ncbi:MAG: nitrate/nitrite transporter [Myxococcota bacterium]|jgi:MFS family permease
MTAAAAAVSNSAGATRWLALIGALFVQAVSIGATLVAFGFMQVPVSQTFGASIDTVSLGFVLFMPAQAFAGLALGPLVDRIGPRVVMLGGAVVAAAGCALIYRADALWIAGIGFSLLVAAGAVGLGPLPTSKLIVGWFPEQPGTALGINAIGPSIGALLAPKLIPLAIGAWGWRGAVAACGIGFAAMIPLVLAIVREARGAAPALAPAAAPADRSYLRDRNFWVLTVGFGLSLAPLVSLGNAYPPYVTETRGLSASFAGNLLLAASVVGIAANLLFGRLADRFPRRPLIWCAQIPLLVSVAALALEPQPALLLPLAVIAGAGQGLTALWTATIGDRFAPESFGSVMGAMGLCMLPFTMSGVQFPMAVFASTGRFELAFAGFAVVLALAAAAIGFLGPKRASA